MKDIQTYELQSTSKVTAAVTDIELGESDGLTRKVLRASVLDNPKNGEKQVAMAIVHQRRAKPDVGWEDLGGPGLNNLKAGQSVKMPLDRPQTRELFEHLANLYAAAQAGVSPGRTVLAVSEAEALIAVDANRGQLIEQLLEQDHAEEVWQALVDTDPDLATKMAQSRVIQTREETVREFEESLSTEKDEEYWQRLLARNTWIFGNCYTGRIGERRINTASTLDHPLIADDGGLEVVEIKKPGFPFWALSREGHPYLYRGKYRVPHGELRGAIAQASNYIFELEREIDSREWAKQHDGILPLKPRCLIVHGRSDDWTEDDLKAFRLLNDSLHGITVITFDHLLVRAKQCLRVFESPIQG